MPILIRKLHEFLVEADITSEEWLATCNLLVQAGQVSSEKRNEVVLVSDVLGVESLVNTLDQTRPARQGLSANDQATYSAILGPFYRAGVPVSPNGECIIRQDEAGAPYTFLHGVVHDAQGKPLANALVDIWHDAPDGLYDAQTPEKPEYHCRGRFQTDAQGRYSTICLKPTPYPIPYDFSAGALLKLLDRHPFRPGHIHFWIEAAGHRTLVTQIFDRESEYLKDDSVFAVKNELIVDFKPVTAETKVSVPADFQGKMVYELQQDFHLQATA
jgi:catechol 1,2-dioxygenase